MWLLMLCQCARHALLQLDDSVHVLLGRIGKAKQTQSSHPAHTVLLMEGGLEKLHDDDQSRSAIHLRIKKQKASVQMQKKHTCLKVTSSLMSKKIKSALTQQF